MRASSVQILIEVFRHKAVESVPRHLPRRHVVHQMREIVGEFECRCRTVGDKRGTAFSAHALGFCPRQDQFGERDIAVKAAKASGTTISALSVPAICAKLISSSSIWPSGTMRGRMAASPPIRRGTPRAPGDRRAASADRAWRAPVRAAPGWPESRAPAGPRAAHQSAPAETAPKREC